MTKLSQEERLTFYKSKEWRQTREVILKRDKFECQECKRNGKVTTGERLDVDHLLELEDYPELALEPTNLETKCVTCHNKKHKRFMKKENKWDDEKW
ncbi:HNH endonuclease [Listeria fleischmannii]|uniref:HNH endonuclease n=1 Tax=Listeria fleischmannii TaxID=1069827 RepID=UPI000254F9D1|nr:HNH endonuclease signature motif containing protein [Listeria fleischmannii]EIA21413.1 phi77 ORF040-like protein [Listeria fleischmannii subsp. coloradonensis]MBC1420091.1 HNH endonuclease [Listeria fleischmannii]